MAESDLPDGDTGGPRWETLLSEATERFVGAGLDSPAVDARRIVEQAAGIEASEVHAILRDRVTVRGIARFDAMVERRIGGEPLQYVLGRWAFRSLDLMVDRRVLVPRPETEVVAGLAIEAAEARARALDRDILVVDLGTGSGAIALAVATECRSARVMATDRSPDALAVARANLAGIGREATRVSLHEGSWFAALPDLALGSVDVVVANPPYVADAETIPDVVARWEPAGALRAGPLGTEQLEAIVADAPRWLAPEGRLVLEMAPHQTAGIAARLAELDMEVIVHTDLSGRDRAVVAHAAP